MITVLIADDYQIVRSGLTHIINEQEDMSVIARAKNGQEAVAKALDLQPDVVIMDVYMPKKNGLDATEEITKKNSEIKVIVLTMKDREELLLNSLQSGASGYLLKSDSDKDLLEAIRAVSNGNVYLKPDSIKKLLEDYLILASKSKKTLQILPLK